MVGDAASARGDTCRSARRRAGDAALAGDDDDDGDLGRWGVSSRDSRRYLPYFARLRDSGGALLWVEPRPGWDLLCWAHAAPGLYDADRSLPGPLRQILGDGPLSAGGPRRDLLERRVAGRPRGHAHRAARLPGGSRHPGGGAGRRRLHDDGRNVVRRLHRRAAVGVGGDRTAGGDAVHLRGGWGNRASLERISRVTGGAGRLLPTAHAGR